MDITKFTERKTGQLRELLGGARGRDWAFVPDPLPPKWEFPNRLWPLLDEATSELARLDGAGRHIQNPNLVIHPLQMREAVRSSSLEGTFAQPEEVMLFQMNPRTPQSEHDKANDWLEVANYTNALRKGFDILQADEWFSCEMIRTLHKTLLMGVRGRDKQPGEFRNVPVQIDSNARFIPPPPKDMQSCLEALDKTLSIKDRHAIPNAFHPLVWCYLVHYQFEAIHPFRDGNGRIGRVLLSLMTYKLMDLQLPWLYMSSFYDRFKSEYKNNLFECSSDGKWEQWIEYCLRGTLFQAIDSRRRLDALVLLCKQYHEQADGSGARYHAIIEDLFIKPIVTVPELENKYNITWPTAKSDIDALIQCGILEPLEGPSKPRVYYAPRIFDIAYYDDFGGHPQAASLA